MRKTNKHIKAWKGSLLSLLLKWLVMVMLQTFISISICFNDGTFIMWLPGKQTRNAKLLVSSFWSCFWIILMCWTSSESSPSHGEVRIWSRLLPVCVVPVRKQERLDSRITSSGCQTYSTAGRTRPCCSHLINSLEEHMRSEGPSKGQRWSHTDG